MVFRIRLVRIFGALDAWTDLIHYSDDTAILCGVPLLWTAAAAIFIVELFCIIFDDWCLVAESLNRGIHQESRGFVNVIRRDSDAIGVVVGYIYNSERRFPMK